MVDAAIMFLFGVFFTLIGFRVISPRWVFIGVPEAKRERGTTWMRWVGLLLVVCGVIGFVLWLTAER